MKIFRYKKGWATKINLPRMPGEVKKHKWVYGKTKEEVQEKVDVIRYLITTDQYIEETKMSVQAYLRQWLTIHKKNIAPHTYAGYKTNIERHIIPYLGNIPLKDLTAFKIQSHYAKLLESGRADKQGKKEGLGLSPTSVLYVHRVFKKALNAAVKMKLIRENPALDVTPPRKVTKGKHDGLYTETQIVDMLTAFQDDRLEVPLTLASCMGLRRGEILGLTWDHVDLEN